MRLALLPALFTLAAWGADAPVPLSSLLQEAAQNNPEILSARRAWQAAAQVPSQVATMPDPQVTLQGVSAGSPRPFAGFTNSDFAYIGVGVSQDLPYPGKLKLKGEAAQEDAAITRQKVESVTRLVLQQVKDAYFQLSYIQQTLEVIDRNGRLLDELEKITDARYRAGQGSQQEVLRAQLERTKLQREVLHHHELMQTQQALLAKLLNRAPGTPGIVPEPLVETTMSATVDELLDRVRTNNPDVAAQKEMINRSSLQVEMARKDRYPDFGVQYMWQHTGEPFRDYYMASVSVRLPIFRSRKLDPEMTQAVEEMNKSKRDYEAQVQSAFFELRSQYIAAETAGQMLKIYREGLIPQALATYQSGLAAYQNGRQDFQTLLSSFMDVLNFDQEFWKALAEHESALAKIEQLTGEPMRGAR